jgi:plasmid stabilization system protein ParE
MKEVTIKYSKKAKEDLEEMSEYYSPRSKQRKIISDRIDSLKEQPLRGRPVPELDDEHIRQVGADNYRIIYHVAAEYLLMILRIFSFKKPFNPDEDIEL